MNKGNGSEKKSDDTEKTIAELKQELAQRRTQQKHKKRIGLQKTEKADIDGLDVICLFCLDACRAREQYEESVAAKLDYRI